MTVTLELPEALAGRLAVEASRRGVSVEELAVEVLNGRYGSRAPGGDALEAFTGSFDSGDPGWAGTDTRERAQAATRRSA